MIKFLKIIFTWWNGQTIGTFLNTLFFGKLVGIDDSKNKYYVDSKDRRWVIFNSDVEATKIPPEWHAWMHHLIKEVPSQKEFSKYKWQKIIRKIKLVLTKLIILINTRFRQKPITKVGVLRTNKI